MIREFTSCHLLSQWHQAEMTWCAFIKSVLVWCDSIMINSIIICIYIYIYDCNVRDVSQHEKRFRRFGFLRKPSSVMTHTHRRYCINTGWMIDGRWMSWSTPRTLFKNCGEREWSTSSLVTSALSVTSGRLDGPWSSALGSIIEHWGRGMCWPRWLLNLCLPPDGLVQAQGYGFAPSHPDLVSIGVLAHPTRVGPSHQQREGHSARNVHHSAEVITQSTGIDYPFYDYFTITTIVTYHYCMALYLNIQPFVYMPLMSPIRWGSCSCLCLFNFGEVMHSSWLLNMFPWPWGYLTDSGMWHTVHVIYIMPFVTNAPH